MAFHFSRFLMQETRPLLIPESQDLILNVYFSEGVLTLDIHPRVLPIQ